MKRQHSSHAAAHGGVESCIALIDARFLAWLQGQTEGGQDNARLHLHDVHCERLAGDGWDAYVKPFRSIEDVHVLAALTSWQYGLARECRWPQSLQLRLLALLAGCAEVARQNPSAPATHVLLAGLFDQQAALKHELDQAFSAGPEHWAALWQRDRNLLFIAAGARAKRLEKALAVLGIQQAGSL